MHQQCCHLVKIKEKLSENTNQKILYSIQIFIKIQMPSVILFVGTLNKVQEPISGFEKRNQFQICVPLI